MDGFDPAVLCRLRDGVYAPDLLVTAVAELDVFSWLARAGPVTSEQLCHGLGLAPRPADVLITYCAALRVLARDGDQVLVTDAGRRYLTGGSQDSLRPYFASLAERPACAELLQVLRTGRPAAWASAGSQADDGRDWAARLDDVTFARRITAAMDARGRYLGPPLARTLDGLEMRRVLDVAGSSGVYLRALLDRRPQLRGTVFERPPVDTAARILLADAGYADRIAVSSGDMFVDALPSGHDVHLYSHVLHDWDADRVGALLAASFDALPPGGWLVDHDAHIDDDKRGPLPVAEYSVLLMHSTPGKCWSTGELAELAASVGFVDITDRPTAGDRSGILARKPD